MTADIPITAYKMNCAFCSARPLGLCGALGDGEGFRELRDARRGARLLDSGAPIYRQGDRHGDLYNLVSGWVCLHQDLEDGRRQILRFILPGELFGQEPAGMTSMSHASQALTNISLCVIPAERVTDLRARYPGFSDRFVWMLERDNHLTMDHLTSLGQRSALERVAHLMLELAVRSSRRYPLAPGDRFKMPLTQPLIADATGLTPIHVNRMLRRLREDHILDLRNGALTVLDPGRLEAMVGPSEDLVRLWTRYAIVEGLDHDEHY
ncbi:MAG: Crp/Fnr family transcriptional regulator [Caulobacteraceae bacterium]|nr:Crp/Fnr family transcriptional regulator [Caulobacteraceae bacterium]